MFKQFMRFIGIVVLLACFAIPAALADDMEDLTQSWTYMHSSFMEAAYKDMSGEEVYEKFTFLPLENHGFTDRYAYGTQDGKYQLVFTPDKAGTGIIRVNLIGSFDKEQMGEFDVYQEYLYHVYGILVPWVFSDDEVKHAIGDTDKYSRIYLLGAELKPDQHTEDLQLGDLGILACYRSGSDFGIAIDFNKPVTSGDLMTGIMLMSLGR